MLGGFETTEIFFQIDDHEMGASIVQWQRFAPLPLSAERHRSQKYTTQAATRNDEADPMTKDSTGTCTSRLEGTMRARGGTTTTTPPAGQWWTDAGLVSVNSVGYTRRTLIR